MVNVGGFGGGYPSSNNNYSGYGAPAHQVHPTVLDMPQSHQHEVRATVMDAVANASFTPAKTVVGYGGVVQNGNSEQSSFAGEGSKKCPHCGYNALPGFDDCPNCGKPLDGSIPPEEKSLKESTPASRPEIPMMSCTKCNAEIPATSKFCPECGEKMAGTIIIGRNRREELIKEEPEPVVQPPTPKCSLTVVPEDEGEKEQEPRHYEGTEIMLNRKNTEPANRTITQKEQAVLTYNDGKWYIENRSSSNPTFIVASRPIELQQGDVIVMGDRNFVFSNETEIEQTDVQ